MDRDAINDLLGMTEEEMNVASEAYENDRWDSSDFGRPTVGRPAFFDEAMGTVSFKEEKPKIVQIDQRASDMGMSRSDYLRHLVDRDLATA